MDELAYPRPKVIELVELVRRRVRAPGVRAWCRTFVLVSARPRPTNTDAVTTQRLPRFALER